MEFFSLIVILVLAFGALFLLFRRKNLGRPPCIQGWIPWIGAGFEFGKAPLEFIEKARIKYGPVFTVLAMGNRMTFVTEEEGINVFLKSKHISVELAIQSLIHRTASIPKDVFYALHEKLYAIMKGKMGMMSLPQFTAQLTEELQQQLENLGSHGTGDLSSLVRRLFYPVTVNALFKKGLFLNDETETEVFYQHFETYDKGFEYGSQMPEWLWREWSKSKRWFLSLFKNNIAELKADQSAKDDSMTLMQTALDIIEKESGKHCPNYGLLMLWASLANVAPVAFWTLAFILSHPDIHRSILEGISSVFGSSGKGQITISEDDLKTLLPVKWCILEAIRLRAPGALARKVEKPLKILGYTVPSGDLLMLSPFWLHRNPKYFPEPDVFKPERWREANLEKQAFLNCFYAFGWGKFLCPGRSVQRGCLSRKSAGRLLWREALCLRPSLPPSCREMGEWILFGWPVVLCVSV